MKFAIIADDLTGSSDSGVQFARRGLISSVLFNIETMNLEKMNADVVVVDTDSRGLKKEEAYQRVTRAAEKIKAFSFDHLYKKVDSTLRGNIGAEVDAVLEIIPKDFAIIAPAYPTIGRTTQNGEHYLNGKLIHETEISRDPKTPVLESNIEKLLHLQNNRQSATLTISDILQGENHIENMLQQFKAEGIQLVVADALEEEHLQMLVEGILATKYDVLWVGSAGLANHLVSVLGVTKESINDNKLERKEEPVLVVAGSLSQVTKGQIEYMKKQDDISAVEMNPTILFNQETRKVEMDKCAAKISEELNKGINVVLHVGTSKEQIAGAMENGAKIGFTSTEVSNYIAQTLGEIVSTILGENAVAGLVLTGGDTAKAVSEQIGVSGMELIKEVETGIPLGLLVGEKQIPAVTKAGAFGSEEALYKSVKLLKGDE